MQKPVELTFETPVTEAARRMLSGQMIEILEQVPLVLSPEQIVAETAVHDLRVALRRSLTLLDALAPWFDPGWLSKQKILYRALLRSLGIVRDADVLAGLAENYFNSPAGAGSGLQGGQALLERLRQRRDAAHRKLCHQLTSDNFTRKLARQAARLNRTDVSLKMMPQAISAKGAVHLFRIGEIVPVMLYQAASRLTVYHTLVRATESGDPVDDAVLHQLRIAAKHFRYTVEHSQSLLGTAGRTLIREFRVFQDRLGDWHDAVVACALLTSLEASSGIDAHAGSDASGDDARESGLTDMEKEAVHSWFLHQEKQRDNLRLAFMELWRQMTPAWFHEHLSAALDSLYAAKPAESDTGS